MNRQLRTQIEKTVHLILKELNCAIPIGDMDSIVTQLHGRIEEVDVVSTTNIVRMTQGEQAFVLQVQRSQSPAQRNIAIAHGLGVLFLHMGYLCDPTQCQVRQEINDSEYLSSKFIYDEFAANFLMPKKEYLDYVYTHMSHNEIDVFSIADYFGVTIGTAIKRGKWLEVLQW